MACLNAEPVTGNGRVHSLLIIGLIGVVATSCASDASEPSHREVAYDLVSSLGQPLPVDLGDVDPRFGGTGCRRLLSDGFLALDHARTGFRLEYRTLSSCGLRVVSHDKSSGQFETAGDTTTLVETSSGGFVRRWRLHATSSDRTLSGEVHGLDMQFHRR
jgi:hypothetical protein